MGCCVVLRGLLLSTAQLGTLSWRPHSSSMVALALYLLVALLAADVECSGKATSSCPVDKFDCRNGKCITGSHWCDGIDHCGNNADELSCRICLSGSLKCKASTQCVPSGARCNGETECHDGSDELGCEMMTDLSVAKTERGPLSETQANQTTNGASMVSLSFGSLVLLLVSAISITPFLKD